MQYGARRTHRSVAVLLIALLGTLLPGGPSASAATRTGAYEQGVVRSVNEQRASHGLPPLRSSTRVADCYDKHAERGARALKRTGVSAYSLSRANDECPRTALGEALGRMKLRPARLVARWMRDSGRRGMLLHPSADHIAVGAVRDSRGVWSVDVYVVEGRWGAEDSTGPTGGGGELVAATNAERAEVGVRELAVLACLNANAQRHAERMAATGVLQHQSLRAVQEECGFHQRVGENVATNGRGPGAMIEQWMGSETHRNNILHPDHRYVGVGAAQDADGQWWGVQVFFGAQVG